MPGRDRKKRDEQRKRKAEERSLEGPSERNRRLQVDAEKHAEKRRNESPIYHRTPSQARANAERTADQRNNETQEVFMH